LFHGSSQLHTHRPESYAQAAAPLEQGRAALEAGYVGGQEDMILDVAIRLAEQRDGAVATR
jgi:hypothetical protein